MAGSYDLTITRGDSFSQAFTFETDDGTPYALPTATWLGQIRRYRSLDADVEATFTVDASDAANGVISISLDETVTADLPNGVWDLQVTDGGNVTTWLQGRVLMEGQVSNA